MDITKSIEPRSDQMNAEDLLGGPRTFTITEVREGNGEQPVWIYLAEFPQARPFKPSKTVTRLMGVAWGMDTDAWIGKRITLYRDPEVRFGGVDVGGIRLSHMSGIPGQLSIALSVSRGRRAMFLVDCLADEAAADARASRRQLADLVEAFRQVDIIERQARLAYCQNVVQHSLQSAADLTADEAATVIGTLQPKQLAEPEAQSALERAEAMFPDPDQPSEDEQAAAAERELEQNGAQG